MFRIKDKVYDIRMGWGVVVSIDKDTYPVRVEFKNNTTCYTIDGKYTTEDLMPSLYFEEIPIPETASIRPRWRADKHCKFYYVTSLGTSDFSFDSRGAIDNAYFESWNYFKTREEAEESKFYKVFK